jgi:hypothetical protein
MISNCVPTERFEDDEEDESEEDSEGDSGCSVGTTPTPVPVN